MKNRPHELYKVVTYYVREEEQLTKYVFGTDHVPDARDRAIEDCGIWPAIVTVYSWDGKHWRPISRDVLNGGLMRYEKAEAGTELDDL